MLKDKYIAPSNRIVVFFRDQEEEQTESGLILPGHSARETEKSDLQVERKINDAVAEVLHVGTEVDLGAALYPGSFIKCDGSVTKLETVFPSDKSELGSGVICSIQPYNVAAILNPDPYVE